MGCTGSNQTVEAPNGETMEFALQLGLAQKTCKVSGEKRKETIAKKKKELSNYFKPEHMKTAMNITQSIIKDENFIIVMVILNKLFESIKSKLNSLAPSGECPTSLRPPLDSIVYASKKLNIDELNQLREKISKMYGEDYIKKASNNEDQIVNQELIQKLNETIPEETIKKKLTTFINEEKIIRASKKSMTKSNVTNNNSSVNNQSQNQAKKNNESNLKKSEDKTNQSSRQSQPSNTNTNNPRKDPEDVLKLLEDKNYNPFDQETCKTLKPGEEIEQKKDEKNYIDLDNQETYKTMHISVANPENKDNPREGDINDIFAKDAKVKDPFDVDTIKLKEEDKDKENKKPEEIDNFDPAKMPNPLDIPTLKVEEMPIIGTKEGADPFDKNAKIDDPFNCETLKDEEMNVKPNEGADPFDKNAKINDPFNCETLKEEEINVKG